MKKYIINSTIYIEVINLINKKCGDKVIPTEVNIVLKEIWPMLLLFIIVISTLRIVDAIINKNRLVIYKDLLFLSFVLYMFLLYFCLPLLIGLLSILYLWNSLVFL